MKTLVTALVLSLTPAMALAWCSGYGQSTTANQCGEGQTWDADAEACVAITTS